MADVLLDSRQTVPSVGGLPGSRNSGTMDAYRRGTPRNPKNIQDALKFLAQQLSQPTPQFDRPYLTSQDAAMNSEEAAHQQQVQEILKTLMEKFRRGGGMPPLGGGLSGAL